jgi:predicted PurR-regulated permease PerM
VVSPDPSRTYALADVVSRREARLVFWLVVLSLGAFVISIAVSSLGFLATPAVILFVAWLMAYVLEPPVSWLQHHLPFHGRGIPVAITYVVSAVVAIVVLSSAGLALLNAGIAFANELPALVDEARTVLQPVISALGLSAPTNDQVIAAIQNTIREYGAEIADAASSAVRNLVGVFAALVTAVFISVGLAVGQVSLLGWLRRFLPERSYRDLTELERAIATSFGGFVRGRILIGAIYGAIIAITAIVFGVPYAPLIGVIAGMIVFIPWIGPLLGWAVLPAFASLLEPSVVLPCFIVSLIGAIAIQLVVTQFIMAGAVRMTPVAVFVVVIIGTAVAGIIGAIFAIPVAAAILAITDYLRQRDVLLRSADAEPAEIAAAG